MGEIMNPCHTFKFSSPQCAQNGPCKKSACCSRSQLLAAVKKHCLYPRLTGHVLLEKPGISRDSGRVWSQTALTCWGWWGPATKAPSSTAPLVLAQVFTLDFHFYIDQRISLGRQCIIYYCQREHDWRTPSVYMIHNVKHSLMYYRK